MAVKKDAGKQSLAKTKEAGGPYSLNSALSSYERIEPEDTVPVNGHTVEQTLGQLVPPDPPEDP